MDATEIRTAVAALEKARAANDTPQLLTLLARLEQDVIATEALLRETKVGVHVNKLKSHADPQVAALVKRTIKKWKDQVSADKRRKSSNGSAKATVSANANANANATAVKAEMATAAKIEAKTDTVGTANKLDKTTNNASGTVKAKGPRTPASDGVSVEKYPDTTRNKSIAALYTALAVDTTQPADSILETCTAIESAIHTNLSSSAVNDAYRTKLRSLIMNIKNKNNQQLRDNILDGTISPGRLVTMTSEELAPASLRKELQQLHQKNLFEAQGAVEKRAVTDRFVCGKCKMREVSYYQMQTRSADEPLTTFCTCEKCGNRWKFC